MRALLVTADEPRWHRLADEVQATVCFHWTEGYEVVILPGDVVPTIDHLAIQRHLQVGRHLLIIPPIPTPLSLGSVAGTSNRIEVVGYHQGKTIQLSPGLMTTWAKAGGVTAPSIAYQQRIATPLPLEVLATDGQGSILLFSHRSNTNVGYLVISCLWLGTPVPGTNGADRRLLLRLTLDWLQGQGSSVQSHSVQQMVLPEKLEPVAHLLAVVLAYNNGILCQSEALAALESAAQAPVAVDHFETVCRHLVAEGILNQPDLMLKADLEALDAYLRRRGLYRAVQLLKAREERSRA